MDDSALLNEIITGMKTALSGDSSTVKLKTFDGSTNQEYFFTILKNPDLYLEILTQSELELLKQYIIAMINMTSTKLAEEKPIGQLIGSFHNHLTIFKNVQHLFVNSTDNYEILMDDSEDSIIEHAKAILNFYHENKDYVTVLNFLSNLILNLNTSESKDYIEFVTHLVRNTFIIVINHSLKDALESKDYTSALAYSIIIKKIFNSMDQEHIFEEIENVDAELIEHHESIKAHAPQLFKNVDEPAILLLQDPQWQTFKKAYDLLIQDYKYVDEYKQTEEKSPLINFSFQQVKRKEQKNDSEPNYDPNKKPKTSK